MYKNSLSNDNRFSAGIALHFLPESEPVSHETLPNIHRQTGFDSRGDLERLEAESALPPVVDIKSFPDGGFEAWLVVVGGFCCLYVSICIQMARSCAD